MITGSLLLFFCQSTRAGTMLKMGPDVPDATVELTPISKFSKYMAAPKVFRQPTNVGRQQCGMKTSRVLLPGRPKDICAGVAFSQVEEKLRKRCFPYNVWQRFDGKSASPRMLSFGNAKSLIFLHPPALAHTHAQTWAPRARAQLRTLLGRKIHHHQCSTWRLPARLGLPFFHTRARLTTSFEVTEPSTELDWQSK